MTQTGYQTVPEAAQKSGLSAAYIRELALEGRIPGAIKLGRDWLVPATFKEEDVVRPEPKADEETRAKWREYQRRYRERHKKVEETPGSS